MYNLPIMRFLVISAIYVSKATQSITWEQCLEKYPVLGDFDSVILDLSSFALQDYQIQAMQNELKRRIYEAIKSNTRIYCITAPASRQIVYSIFPFSLSVRNEDGETFKEKPTDEYFNKVARWDFCFENEVARQDQYTPEDHVLDLEPIATTRHNCLIAFTVSYLSHIITENWGGFVTFLPPQNKSTDQENLNNLIRWINPDNTETLPDFLNKISVKGESELKDAIAGRQKSIIELQKGIEEDSSKLKELEFMKGILAFKGKSLEKAVTRVLADMGIQLEGVEKFEEDGMLINSESKIPVEIKGRDKNIPEADLVQAYGRIVKAEVSDDAPVRGLLIANPYALTPLESRGEDFEHNIAKRSLALNICLLSTRVLFEYWNDYREKGKTNLAVEIFNTPGILTFKPYKEPDAKPDSQTDQN